MGQVNMKGRRAHDQGDEKIGGAGGRGGGGGERQHIEKARKQTRKGRITDRQEGK